MTTKTLDVSYDDETDTVTIEGMTYAAEVFRMHSFCKEGTYLRIESRRDATVTRRGFSPDLQEKFDRLAGLAP
jgi:hypothetical protein